MTIRDYLSGNSYPGRGVLLGRMGGGDAVLAYFIMGRSAGSRDRVFVAEGEELRTRAFDESRYADPSLFVYRAVCRFENRWIVSNGDQTDTREEALRAGEDLRDALRRRTFEPDPPIYTPRIAGLYDLGGAPAYQLAILKSAGGDPSSVRRFFFEYPEPLPGQGHLLHTYQGDGNPVPSFEGEPVCLDLAGYADTDALARELWDSLHPENKVAAFVRRIPLGGGNAETRLFNRRAGD